MTLSLAETASNAPSAAVQSRFEPSPALPAKTSNRPRASSGSAMKLFAYTHSGVAKPSSRLAASAGSTRTPRPRAAA